ncbi:hypothetical protein TRVA0_026S01244 [Trichomonascus vanleenenianus]|uniref:Rcn1p n=1 Tax=Trichomonascus vanleenenianus TaxID=2268995 RepID=UPI003ECB22EE
MNGHPSNTLIVAGLSKPDFGGEPSFAYHLKTLLARHEVPVVHWAPLKSFGRIIVVCETASDAVSAKLVIGTAFIESSRQLRTFFGQHTPLSVFEQGSSGYLQLPDAGRLWLISPPPSPPCDWESKPESEPNKEAFFSDLSEALLDAKRDQEESVVATAAPSASSSSGTRLTRRCTLHESPSPSTPDLPQLNTDIPRSPESSQLPTPTIVLEWDEEEEEENENVSPGPSVKQLPRTELPPVH